MVVPLIMAGSFIDGGGGGQGDDDFEVVEFEEVEPVGGVLGCLQFVGLLAKLALLLGFLALIVGFLVALVTAG